MELSPGVHRPRHANRQHAVWGNCFAMQFRELGFHLIVTQAERRTSAAIDPIKFVLFRAINDSEQIAADAVGDWFH